MACMAAKPIVDGIEREHGAALEVIHLNIQDAAGAKLAEEFGAQYTPTFLLFDSQGELLFRVVGAIDPSQVREAIDALPPE